MKKISNLSVLAVAIIIIIGIVYYYEEIREVKVELPTTPVVVANDYIPENTVITKDMVSLDERYTNDLLKEQKIITSHLDKIIGKRTRVPLYASETIKLDRLLENELYMDGDDNQKQLALALYDTDKALDIIKGDFIDLWLVTTEDGVAAGEISKKMFEKLQVIEVDNKSNQNVEPNGEADKKDKESTVPTIITIELPDNDIETIYNIDKTLFNFRVTRYGEDTFYKVVGDVIDKNKPEVTGEETTNLTNETTETTENNNQN